MASTDFLRSSEYFTVSSCPPPLGEYFRGGDNYPDRGGKLLHGKEERVLGDAGYCGIEKREEHKDRDVNWYIAERPGRRRAMEPGSDEAWIEEFKASMRAKVEHPFRYIKRVFGYDKARYRGLAKNRNRLCVLTAFANLLIGEKYMHA